MNSIDIFKNLIIFEQSRIEKLLKQKSNKEIKDNEDLLKVYEALFQLHLKFVCDLKLEYKNLLDEIELKNTRLNKIPFKPYFM